MAAQRDFRPVFIVGCQRSGSTLLGAMLGAHPNVICIPEGQFIADLMPSKENGSNMDPCVVIDQVTEHWRFRIWQFDLGTERPGPGDVEVTFRGAIEWLVRKYAATHGREHARIWIDQQPGHLLRLPRLIKHFRDAKVVHIVRDGRAVAGSVMPLDWGPNEIYAAARFWQSRVGLGYAAAAFLAPDQLHHVRFEDLVMHPEATMRRVTAFIGIDYAEAMLSGSGLQVPAFTRDQHRLVGQPLAPDRIDAWRRNLSTRQIEIFERVTGPLLEGLGYDLISEPNARPLSFIEKTTLTVKDQAKKVVNQRRFAARRRTYISMSQTGKS